VFARKLYVNGMWKKASTTYAATIVEHHAAQYNATTGEFEWIR